MELVDIALTEWRHAPIPLENDEFRQLALTFRDGDGHSQYFVAIFRRGASIRQVADALSDMRMTLMDGPPEPKPGEEGAEEEGEAGEEEGGEQEEAEEP